MATAQKLDLSGITITPLRGDKCLAAFSCGENEIDRWVRSKCNKHHRQRRARVFCAYNNPKSAAGFYSLGLRPESEENIADAQPFSTDGFIPLIYIEYLAVRRPLQDNGIGKLLFGNALQRAYRIAQNVAVYGVALRSLNERTTNSYKKMGFAVKEGGSHPLMIMPIWTLIDLIEPKSSPPNTAPGTSPVAPLPSLSFWRRMFHRSN
jgi:GNAT superfamily N-acetyltransferase